MLDANIFIGSASSTSLATHASTERQHEVWEGSRWAETAVPTASCGITTEDTKKQNQTKTKKRQRSPDALSHRVMEGQRIPTAHSSPR